MSLSRCASIGMQMQRSFDEALFELIQNLYMAQRSFAGTEPARSNSSSNSFFKTKQVFLSSGQDMVWNLERAMTRARRPLHCLADRGGTPWCRSSPHANHCNLTAFNNGGRLWESIKTSTQTLYTALHGARTKSSPIANDADSPKRGRNFR